jgi:hypothetical protein
MLRKLRSRLTYANVMSTIACFGVLATGTAYAANTVFSSDIVDGQVNSADVKDQSLTTFDVSTFLGADVVDGTLTGADIGNGSLNDEDVGQGTFVDFTANLGPVPAHDCTIGAVTGVNAQGDHLLLTPDATTLNENNFQIIYSAVYRSEESIGIQACNPTATGITANNINFNLLVFDAQ